MVPPVGRIVASMNLNQLTTAELTKTYEAVDYLCKLLVRLDQTLSVKLDTFRADVAAVREDHAARARNTGRLPLAPIQ
jgi:hypothetical protein